jgi:site-specific recombinase XerD
MELGIAIDEFLRVRRLGHYSAHTINNYRRDIAQFHAHIVGLLGREPEANELTRDMVLSHLAECSRRLGRVSVDRHRYALKSFFQWLEDAAIGSSPMRGMLFPRHSYPKLPRFITPEQIAAIIAAEAPRDMRGAHIRHHRALELRDVALIETLFGSAIRIGEAISLNWRDWRLQGPGELFIRLGKGGNDRIALIGEPAIDALEAWSRLAWVKDLDGPIFQTAPRGERLTVRRAELMVKERAQRAGIQEAVTPHYFRHSAATAMMQAGAGIADIGALLGHKNLNTTTKYTHTDIGYLKKQIGFHPRETEPARQIVNPRAVAVRPTKPKEKAMKQVTWEKAATHILSLETSAIQAWDKEKHDPRRCLDRFENDRHATLSENGEPSCALFNLISEPPTLRFFAGHCVPDESAQLLALASRYDDLIAQLITLKAEQNELVAKINFVGASPREVKDVRRELKSLRRAA